MAQRYCESYGDKANKEPLITNVPDITENIYEKPERNRKGSAVLALALAASILTSGCGATANTNNSAEAAKATSNPNKAPITSTEKKPATTETTPVSKAETIPTVESLEIDASLLSDPKALIETVIERGNTQWFNAGATPENAQAALRYKGGIPAYAEKIAAEYDKIFISALLIDNWESNPLIVKWVDKMELIHKQTLTLYFYTSFPDINPEDKTPYMRGAKIKKIVSINDAPDGSYVSVVEDEYNYDNADLNRVGEDLTNGAKVLNTVFEPMITLRKVGDKAKISNVLLGQDVTNKQ